MAHDYALLEIDIAGVSEHPAWRVRLWSCAPPGERRRPELRYATRGMPAQRRLTANQMHRLAGLKGYDHVPRQSPTDAELLAMLAAAPPRIAALTAGLAPAQLQIAPAPGAWSAVEVLAHMRACADMWGGCIAAMLAQDHPTVRAVNPRTWIGQTDYPAQAFHASLRAFTDQRAALLAILEPLAPEGWARSATITGAGKPLERSVRFYVEWLATHERPHVKQIERIANASGVG